jgi:ABC-type protease/lipase transport system fused ATPase/permease subunit
LARAVFGDAFLVVLDEPDANLDIEGEKALARTILTLRAAGRIPIVISHRPNVLGAVNMALLIYGGRMIAFGSRDQVFEQIARSSGRKASSSSVSSVPASSAPAAAPGEAAPLNDPLTHDNDVTAGEQCNATA